MLPLVFNSHGVKVGLAGQGEALARRAMAIGEYFGDKNPDHRSLADGVRADEGEDASRHN